jgi:hybrid cluster-associated redox disulfide protein
MEMVLLQTAKKRRRTLMDKITKDMIIGEVISEKPELIQTFFENGMMCIGCPASQGESIEQASAVHGLDADQLVSALNAALEA